MTFTRPNLRALTDFQGADFFGEEGAEAFSAKTQLECLQDSLAQLEASDMQDEGADAWLTARPWFAWNIGAYKRMVAPASQLDHWTEWLVDMLRDTFGEELGNEEGDDQLSDPDAVELTRRTREVVAWYADHACVYPCEHIASFHLDSLDVREVIAVLRPEWLKKPEPPPSNEAP